jgi:hypothetical protein
MYFFVSIICLYIATRAERERERQKKNKMREVLVMYVCGITLQHERDK